MSFEIEAMKTWNITSLIEEYRDDYSSEDIKGIDADNWIIQTVSRRDCLIERWHIPPEV